MPPETIFARGESIDSAKGINMTSSNTPLRWIAVRGSIEDWAIYVHHAWQDWEWIRHNGDKVHNEETVKKLVPCSNSALELYRH